MQLADILNQMIAQNVAAGQPTELCIGTVSQAEPLEIIVNPAMPPLPSEVLYLTSAVVERKIPILKHTHNAIGLGHSHSCPEGGTSTDLTGSYETTDALEEIVCTEHGQKLPVEGGFIILNRALAVDDKVLLLQVQHGQQFVILSRLFGAVKEVEA